MAQVLQLRPFLQAWQCLVQGQSLYAFAPDRQHPIVSNTSFPFFLFVGTPVSHKWVSLSITQIFLCHGGDKLLRVAFSRFLRKCQIARSNGPASSPAQIIVLFVGV